jgi:hypothetical protein
VCLQFKLFGNTVTSTFIITFEFYIGIVLFYPSISSIKVALLCPEVSVNIALSYPSNISVKVGLFYPTESSVKVKTFLCLSITPRIHIGEWGGCYIRHS